MKILFLFQTFFIFSNLTFADASSCLTSGQIDTGGKVLGSDTVMKIKTPCCKGLVEVFPLDMCGDKHRSTPMGIYSCSKCGDLICDAKYESKCNCPKDCGGQTNISDSELQKLKSKNLNK